MSGQLLQAVHVESDFGITINSDMKPTKHCKLASRKAVVMLGLSQETFDCMTPSVLLKLHHSLVRPQLEYAVQFLSPNYKNDVEMLERMQQ